MRQPGQLRALLAASFCTCLLTTTAFAQGEAVVFARGETTVTQGATLQTGTPVERKLGPGEAHVYNLKLEENMFVQVVVEQRGIDVMVQVTSPAGKSLGDFDSPNGNQGPENVSFVAVSAGTYHVLVGPLDPHDKTSGSYEIKLLEIRQATEQELKTSKNLEVIKAKGLALLNDVDAIIAEIRSPQIRIRGQLQAAQLLSQSDEKRSSKYLNDAANALKDFVANVDPGTNEYMRDYSTIQQLRAELAMALMARDPEAALAFLRSTRMPLDPYGNERERTNQEISLELTIADQIAAKDPKRTIELARQGLKKGYSPNLVQTLSMLKHKNDELATEFANEVAAKLMDETLLKTNGGAYVAGWFVRDCRTAVQQEQKPGLNDVAPERFLSPDRCRDLVQKSYREALSFTLPGPNVYSPSRDAAWNLLNGLRGLGAELDGLFDGGAATVAKKLSELDGSGSPEQAAYQQTQAKLNENGPIEGSLEMIEKIPAEMRESLYTQLANNAAAQGEGARARQILSEKISNPFSRRQALYNVDLQEMYQFMNRGKVEDALRTIGNLRTPRERANLLAQIARQIGPGQKRPAALNLLEQARAMLAPGVQAQDQEQMNALLELARAFSRLDSKRAFEIVDPLVDQVNDICTAARTLEGFGPEYFENDELDMQNGNSVSNVAAQMTGTLGTLAISNFERAKSSADRLRLPEVRLRAYLEIAQQTIQAK